MTGAEAIAALMRRRGIHTVFAYPGTSELALCDAVADTDGMTLVNSRGDKEAVFMAGGANRLSPDGTAAIVHGARGLTNALGAVADVRRSEVPVLCVVGMASTGSAAFLPPHAEFGLIPAAGAFASAFHDCSGMTEPDARIFLDTVNAAFAALDDRPAGPVLLGVPQDVLSARFVPPAELAAAPARAIRGHVPDLTEASAAIAQAERPLVLVDDYVFGAGPEVEEALGNFSSCIGAPVLQVAYQRGPMLFQQIGPGKVPDHLGTYVPTDHRHRDLLDEADLVITVEDRNMYPRVVGSLGGSRKIALTSSPAAALKNGYLASDGLVVAGDVVKTLDALAALQTPRSPWHRPGRPTEQPGHGTSHAGRELVRYLSAGLATAVAPVLVDDSQMFGGLIAKNYDLLPAGTQVHGSHGGFVGSGLATSIGMAVADEAATVICTLGDQGFTNAVQALAVAGDRDVPILVIVCNNGGSVSLRKQSSSEGLGTATAGFLRNVECLDYASTARSFGLEASTVRWPDRLQSDEPVVEAGQVLKRRIEDALADRRPHLIELVTTGAPEFWAGVWNVDGITEMIEKVDR
ncbi:thiamine pyrophosphate-binding protein [Streptomyces sp. CG1]|uniref:thiamine pyrophosphate-binding protein n=1 Tax=Streptomyces sp. CG1 TaxID=1287523 RepID=UPI0034E220DD